MDSCRRYILALLIALPTIFVLVNSAKAEEVEDLYFARSRFFIDHACFADSGGTDRFELYYKIFNDGLNYVKRGEQYVANYEMNVIVLGDKDRQVTGKSIEKTYTVDSYDNSKSQSGFLINQVNLSLKPGNYDVVCKLIDHVSNEVSTIEAKVKCPDFNRGSDISDVQFIRATSDSAGPNQFSKRGYSLIPIVERSLDGDEQKLAFFCELYTVDVKTGKLQLKYTIQNKRLGTEIEKTVDVPSDSNIVGVKEFEDVKQLPPEEYQLNLQLLQDGKVKADRSSKFIVKWTLASLVKNDFEYAVNQLKYLINKDDKKALLQAPESLRLASFEDWWKTKDPTPATPENELRDEYYRRIRYADQYFPTVGRAGWETDRGMVYIKYGEPEQIDRHPFEQGRKPYEIWYYYTQRRTFVFEDTRGDGDYQLQLPYDGDWNKGAGP